MIIKLVSRQPYVAAVLIAFVVLAAVFIGSAYRPIPNEKGFPTSPLHTAPSSDLVFYRKAANLYFESGFKKVFETQIAGFLRKRDQSDGYNVELRATQIAPPLFPLLVYVFDYHQGNTLALAVFYFGLALALLALWLRMFQQRRLPVLWMLAFVFLPHTAWFMINLGSDLLLAIIFAIFYRVYLFEEGGRRHWGWAIVLAIAALMARPTGLSLVAFLGFIFLIDAWKANLKAVLIVSTILGTLSLPLIFIALPYFFGVLESGNDWHYFNIGQKDYVAGLFSDLPRLLDLIISWTLLLGAKILYMFGLRPSYGDTHIALVLLRGAPGIVFLLGTIHLAIRGSFEEKILAAAVMAPIILGPAQDRYLLPLQPILYFHCWKIFEAWHLRRNRSLEISL